MSTIQANQLRVGTRLSNQLGFSGIIVNIQDDEYQLKFSTYGYSITASYTWLELQKFVLEPPPTTMFSFKLLL